MLDDLIKLSAFLGVGLLFWLLSRRYYMRIYGLQPAAALDRWFVVVALLMAGLYDLTVAPLLQWLIRCDGCVASWVRAPVSGMSPVLQLVAFIIATDFLAYWAHRLMHARAVWPVHAFHHSPKSLNWLSGARGSPVHFILTLAPSTLMSSVFLLSDERWIFFVLVFFDVVSQHLSHSNIRLPFERQLEWLLVTPRMHFVHHHPNVRYTNSNYGFYFSLWDHLFGTYVDPDSVVDRGQLGLDYESPTWRLMLGLPRAASGRKPADPVSAKSS